MKTTFQALDHLLCAVGDPIADLRAIGPGHRRFLRAQMIRAAAGVIAKSPGAFADIAEAICLTDVRGVPTRVRAHFAAAQAWVEGDPVLAAETYASILDRWPRDVLALRLAQSCYFFLGRPDRLCTIAEGVLAAWPPALRGYRFALAIASFAHAENGDAALAELQGLESLAIDPACPMGVHAVAHALAESGRPRAGAQWMRDQIAHWAAQSRMRTHNAWHLGMFDAEAGNFASALGILDGWLIPASAASALDACDAAALLLRLHAGGLDDKGRWGKLSDAFAQTMTAGFWPYVDLHAALAHLFAGQTARMQQLARAIDRCALGDDYAARRAREITAPGLRALEAWGKGMHAQAAVLLAGLRDVSGHIGGSRIQLEMFRSIEDDVLRRRMPQQAPLRRVPHVEAKFAGGGFAQARNAA